MNKGVLKISFIYIILLLITASQALSKERYEFYNGIRQLGMGGVAVATVNDETALILNAAALGKLREKYFVPFDPEIEVGAPFYDFFSDNDFDYSKVTSPQGILNTLLNSPDKHYHLKAQVSPSIVLPNFGIGLHAQWNYDAKVDSATNTYNLRYRNDYAGLLGFNIRLFDGRLKIGFTGRYIHRVEVDEELPSSSTNLEYGQLVDEGSGVGADVSMLLTAPWTYLPTLGFVVRDVGNTSYSMGSGLFYDNRHQPETTLQTIDVGASVTPIIAKHIRLQIGVEYRDVTDSKETKDSLSRTHAGMELNFYDHLFIRGGYNQGYWTAGLELAYEVFQFQAAAYGEEIGTKDNREEDRRYVFKFAFRF